MTENFYLEITDRFGNPGKIQFDNFSEESLDVFHAIEETALSQGLICKTIPAEYIDPPRILENAEKI